MYDRTHILNYKSIILKFQIIYKSESCARASFIQKYIGSDDDSSRRGTIKTRVHK
jgi:hypothetical protein